MIKLKRVKKHKDFDSDTSLKKWTEDKYIIHFKEVQFNKCGYCETHTFEGDMDHFRPKGKIHDLVEKDLYKSYEKQGFSKLAKKRSVKEVRKYGYPWLVNIWENYIYSCAICNRKYKRCLFPVDGPRMHKGNKKIIEKCLLLNPFEKSPNSHLTFTELGEIQPKKNSKVGFNTIITCGLNRISLTKRREDYAADVNLAIVAMNNAKTKKDITKALQDLHRMLHEKKEYSGMMRILVQDQLDVSYEEICKKLNIKV